MSCLSQWAWQNFPALLKIEQLITNEMTSANVLLEKHRGRMALHILINFFISVSNKTIIRSSLSVFSKTFLWGQDRCWRGKLEPTVTPMHKNRTSSVSWVRKTGSACQEKKMKSQDLMRISLKVGMPSVSKLTQKSTKPKNLKEVHAADVYHAGKVIPMSQYLLSLVRQKWHLFILNHSLVQISAIPGETKMTPF